MRGHLRLYGSVLLACAVIYGSYQFVSPEIEREVLPLPSKIGAFRTCTEASLDRSSGKTRLGFCPAPGIVTQTAGLP